MISRLITPPPATRGIEGFWKRLRSYLQLPESPPAPESLGRPQPKTLERPLLLSLQRLLGEENVNVQAPTLHAYARGHNYPDFLQAQRQDKAPLAVVKPENEQEIAALMLWAARRELRLLPWGGGLTPYLGKHSNGRDFLVLDLQRMRQLLNFQPEERRLRVQAGARWTDIEPLVAEASLTTGQEFVDKHVSVGGALATNAMGLRTLSDGILTDSVLAVRAVCPTGPVELTTPVPGQPDNRGLMLGARGRWGVITEASLKLHPLSESTETFSVNFSERERALGTLQRILRQRLPLTTAYLLDGQTLQLFAPQQKSRLAVLSQYTRGNKTWSAQLVLKVTGSGEEINRTRRKLEEVLRDDSAQLLTNHQHAETHGFWSSHYKLWRQLWERRLIAHTLCVAVDWHLLSDFLPQWEEGLESVVYATSQERGLALTTVQATQDYALVHTLVLGHQTAGDVTTKLAQLERIQAVGREIKRRWQALPTTSTLVEKAFYTAGQELDPHAVMLT